MESHGAKGTAGENNGGKSMNFWGWVFIVAALLAVALVMYACLIMSDDEEEKDG